MAAGTNRTWSRSRASGPSWASRGWPWWSGLTAPPKTAVRAKPSPTPEVAGAALFPHLPIADHDELRRRQLAGADRATGVDARGRDPHLGAHAEVPAVDEPRRRVDEDDGRVHLAGEAPRVAQVVGHDRLGEARAVAANVLDRRVEGVHDPDRQDQVEVLRVPVRLRRRAGGRHERARVGAA